MEHKASISEKKCTVCKQVKSINEFYKDAQRSDGYYTKYKSCHASHVKNWQIKNPDRFRSANEKWKREHKKERLAHAQKRVKKYPERVRAIAKKTRAKHPETIRHWRENNKDKTRQYAQNRRARLTGNGGTLTVEEWNAILDFYGHKCLCCGSSDVKLTIDHVIPISQGGKHCAENVQPLCGPCNSRKKDKTIDYRKEKSYASPRN